MVVIPVETDNELTDVNCQSMQPGCWLGGARGLYRRIDWLTTTEQAVGQWVSGLNGSQFGWVTGVVGHKQWIKGHS